MAKFFVFRDIHTPVGLAFLVLQGRYGDPNIQMVWVFGHPSREYFETPVLELGELIKECPEILKDVRLMEKLILEGVV